MEDYFDKPIRRSAKPEREERKMRDFTILTDAFAETYEPVSLWCEGIEFFYLSDIRKMFSVWATQVGDPIDELLAELKERGFTIQHDVHNHMGIPVLRRNKDFIPPAYDDEDMDFTLRLNDANAKHLPSENCAG